MVNDFLVDYLVMESDTPIFRSLIGEERFSGLDFPVSIFSVKPRSGFRHGFINYIGGYTRGIEPVYTSFYKRNIRADENDPIYDLIKEYL